MVAWKRGIAILSAGTVKVTPDPRVRLFNGYSLQIRDAVPQDAGDYICQIATLDPMEITHTVEILGKFYLFQSFHVNDCYELLLKTTFIEYIVLFEFLRSESALEFHPMAMSYLIYFIRMILQVS